MNPDQRKQRRRLLIIVIVVIGLAIVLGFTLSRHHKPSSSSSAGQSKTTTTYDANSGETVRTIQGENNSGQPSDYPLFLGTNELLNRGLTTDQLTNMETAFYTYTVNGSLGIKQVSITVNSITASTISPDSNPISVLSFPVIFDSKTTAYATLQYSGLSNTELILKDQKGTQLFDSGIISTVASPSPDT